MKRLFLFLFLPAVALAQDLQTGETLVDGVQYHAADFNNMVNNGTILPSAISGKGSGSPVSADQFLFYQASSTGLKQATFSTLFNNSLSFNTRSALTFLAGPGIAGASAANPTFRAITPHDTAVATNQTVSATIDASLARTFYRLLAANVTYNVTNLQDGQTISVAVRQAATGGPWNSAFSGVWFHGTVVHTTTANSLDIYTIINIAGTKYGTVSQAHDTQQ